MSRNRPSYLVRGFVSALTALALIASAPVIAADSLQDFHREPRSAGGSLRSPSPPVYRDCDMEFSADEYNDRVDCKTENANVSLYDYIDTVIQFDKMRRSMGREPIFTDSQMEQMLAGRERAQSAKNRSHAAQVFRGTAKKQKSEDEDCYTKEIIGDNKGDDEQPCVAGEDCEEVLDDGIGNDDGKCRLKGNNREVCVQVCQQPLLTDMDTYDSDQAYDTEKGLEELDTALIDAADEMKRAMSRMQDAYRESLAQPADNDCDMYEFDLRPTATALQVSQVAKNASGAAFNGCSVVCNQDAFGWNCEAACLAFAIVDGILNGVNDALAIADGNNGSAQLDRVAKCTTQLDTTVDGISASVDDNAAALDAVEEQLDDVTARLDTLTAQIDALTAMMIQRFDTVDGYLCVPQGQRECFPGGTEGTIAPVELTSPDRTSGPTETRRR